MTDSSIDRGLNYDEIRTVYKHDLSWQLQQYMTPVDLANKILFYFSMENIDKSITVTDACCGDGVFTYLLNQFGYRTISFDIDEKLINLAKMLMPNYEFVVHDLKRPFDRLTDIVICNPPYPGEDFEDAYLYISNLMSCKKLYLLINTISVKFIRLRFSKTKDIEVLSNFVFPVYKLHPKHIKDSRNIKVSLLRITDKIILESDIDYVIDNTVGYNEEEVKDVVKNISKLTVYERNFMKRRHWLSQHSFKGIADIAHVTTARDGDYVVKIKPGIYNEMEIYNKFCDLGAKDFMPEHILVNGELRRLMSRLSLADVEMLIEKQQYQELVDILVKDNIIEEFDICGEWLFTHCSLCRYEMTIIGLIVLRCFILAYNFNSIASQYYEYMLTPDNVDLWYGVVDFEDYVIRYEIHNKDDTKMVMILETLCTIWSKINLSFLFSFDGPKIPLVFDTLCNINNTFNLIFEYCKSDSFYSLYVDIDSTVFNKNSLYYIKWSSSDLDIQSYYNYLIDNFTDSDLQSYPQGYVLRYDYEDEDFVQYIKIVNVALATKGKIVRTRCTFDKFLSVYHFDTIHDIHFTENVVEMTTEAVNYPDRLNFMYRYCVNALVRNFYDSNHIISDFGPNYNNSQVHLFLDREVDYPLVYEWPIIGKRDFVPLSICDKCDIDYNERTIYDYSSTHLIYQTMIMDYKRLNYNFSQLGTLRDKVYKLSPLPQLNMVEDSQLKEDLREIGYNVLNPLSVSLGRLEDVEVSSTYYSHTFESVMEDLSLYGIGQSGSYSMILSLLTEVCVSSIISKASTIDGKLPIIPLESELEFKNKASSGAFPYGKFGNLLFTIKSISGSCEAYFKHRSHSICPSATGVTLKVAISSKPRSRTIIMIGPVEGIIGKTLYSSTRKACSKNHVSGYCKIGLSRVYGGWDKLMRTFMDNFKGDPQSSITMYLDFPSWDRFIDNYRQLTAGLQITTVCDGNDDSSITYNDRVRAVETEFCNVVYNILVLKNKVFQKGAGVTSGNSKTADGNSVIHLSFIIYAHLYLVCFYRGNDAKLVEMRDYIFSLRNMPLRDIFIMGDTIFERIREMFDYYTHYVADIFILSDDGSSHLDITKAPDIKDLFKIISIQSNFKFTPDKYGFEVGINPPHDFCSAISVIDDNGLYQACPDFQRVISSMVYVQSIKHLHPDIRFFRLFSLLVESWNLQYNKHASEHVRSFPRKFLEYLRTKYADYKITDEFWSMHAGDLGGVIVSGLEESVLALMSDASKPLSSLIDEYYISNLYKYKAVVSDVIKDVNVESLQLEAYYDLYCFACGNSAQLTCEECIVKFTFCNKIIDGHARLHADKCKHYRWSIKGKLLRCQMECREDDIRNLHVNQYGYYIVCTKHAGEDTIPIYDKQAIRIGVMDYNPTYNEEIIEHHMDFLYWLSIGGLYNETTLSRFYTILRYDSLKHINILVEFARAEFKRKQKAQYVEFRSVRGNVFQPTEESVKNIRLVKSAKYTLYRNNIVIAQCTLSIAKVGEYKVNSDIEIDLKVTDKLSLEIPTAALENITKANIQLTPLIQDLLSNVRRTVGNITLNVLENMNPFQMTALLEGLTNNFTIVQGVPGSGKTTLECQLIYAAYNYGKRVLVVSPNHVAVDTVGNKFYDYAKRHGVRVQAYRNMPSERNVMVRTKWPEFYSGARDMRVLFSSIQTNLPDMTFDFVILEESSTVIDIFLIYVLWKVKAKQVFIVGDYKQLPPVLEFDLSPQYTNYINWFSNFYGPHVMLSIQYRMDLGISEIVSGVFYEDKLVCGVNNTLDISENFNIILTSSSKSVVQQYTVFNNEEVNVAIKLMQYFDNIYKIYLQHVTPTMCVLCFYHGTRATLESKYLELGLTLHWSIHTVDSSQGSEYDVVIILPSTLNSFTSSMNRSNVAISRAKHRCIYLINEESWFNYEPFKSIYNKCNKFYKSVDDFIGEYKLTLQLEACDKSVDGFINIRYLQRSLDYQINTFSDVVAAPINDFIAIDTEGVYPVGRKDDGPSRSQIPMLSEVGYCTYYGSDGFVTLPVLYFEENDEPYAEKSFIVPKVLKSKNHLYRRAKILPSVVVGQIFFNFRRTVSTRPILLFWSYDLDIAMLIKYIIFEEGITNYCACGRVAWFYDGQYVCNFCTITTTNLKLVNPMIVDLQIEYPNRRLSDVHSELCGCQVNPHDAKDDAIMTFHIFRALRKKATVPVYMTYDLTVRRNTPRAMYIRKMQDRLMQLLDGIIYDVGVGDMTQEYTYIDENYFPIEPNPTTKTYENLRKYRKQYCSSIDLISSYDNISGGNAAMFNVLYYLDSIHSHNMVVGIVALFEDYDRYFVPYDGDKECKIYTYVGGGRIFHHPALKYSDFFELFKDYDVSFKLPFLNESHTDVLLYRSFDSATFRIIDECLDLPKCSNIVINHIDQFVLTICENCEKKFLSDLSFMLEYYRWSRPYKFFICKYKVKNDVLLESKVLDFINAQPYEKFEVLIPGYEVRKHRARKHGYSRTQVKLIQLFNYLFSNDVAIVQGGNTLLIGGTTTNPMMTHVPQTPPMFTVIRAIVGGIVVNVDPLVSGDEVGLINVSSTLEDYLKDRHCIQYDVIISDAYVQPTHSDSFWNAIYVTVERYLSLHGLFIIKITSQYNNFPILNSFIKFFKKIFILRLPISGLSSEAFIVFSDYGTKPEHEILDIEPLYWALAKYLVENPLEEEFVPSYSLFNLTMNKKYRSNIISLKLTSGMIDYIIASEAIPITNDYELLMVYRFALNSYILSRL